MVSNLAHRHLLPGITASRGPVNRFSFSSRVLGCVASRWTSSPGRAEALHQWLIQLQQWPGARWYAPLQTSASNVLAGLTLAGELVAESLSTPFTISSRNRYSDSWRPESDQATIRDCHSLAVLWLRNRSQVAEQLIAELRRCSCLKKVVVPLDQRLIPEHWLNELLASGAIGVEPHDFAIAPPAPPFISKLSSELPPPTHWPWLTHSTRFGDRPRAGESRAEFFARIVRGPALALGTPLQVLGQVLSEKRVAARRGATRGSKAVTCWSATSIPERLAARTYRRGRGHWDEASCGIAISQTWAQQMGLQPVIYGNEATCRNLSDDQLCFYQPAQTAASDWSREREWRGIGDLDLEAAPADHAWAFAATESEARWLRRFTQLPVIALEQVASRQSWSIPSPL